jgi:predicted RNA-binding protein with PUA-like domain
MNYWLVKSEPESYSWEDLQQKGEDIWDGIRNYQARNYLQEMKLGDQVFFYHSGKDKAIVGLAAISQEAFQDPNDNEQKGWLAVRLKADRKLDKPVPLSQMKANDALKELALFRQSRLSVMPVASAHFELIIALSQ